MIQPQIVFEDDDFLVIDKPSGLTVNKAETTAKMETVQDWIDERYKMQETRDKSAEEFASRSGIVHRLDKDTSGLLIIAKTPKAFENLKSQFKGREVMKKYLGLVHGKVEPVEGTINAPIERNPFNRKHFGVFPGGREATTDFKLLKVLKLLREEFSHLELTPHTGRTHQIRVHLKYINHPIVSDPIYGGRKNIREDLRFCPRLFLHATYLRLKHPANGEVQEFNSSLPADLQGVLDRLQ